MDNFWLRTKGLAWKSTTISWTDDPDDKERVKGTPKVRIELTDGSVYNVTINLYWHDPKPMMCTRQDPSMFYQNDKGEWKSKIKYDSASDLRYGIVERIAYSVFFSTGAMNPKDYPDAVECYEQYPLPAGYFWPERK